MEYNDILFTIKILKTKNCEGHDHLPQRILTDGINVLIAPLSLLFQKIYEFKRLPKQWLISKTIPILKKGTPQNIAILDLCSTSKIFENLF